MTSIVDQVESLRDKIRRKHRAFKSGVVESEEFLAKQFRPIVEPLREIAKGAKNDVKMEGEVVKMEGEEEDLLKSPIRPIGPSPFLYTRSPAASLIDSMSENNPSKYYLQLLMTDTSNSMDNVYGVYFKNNRWMIGSMPVQFGDKTLRIESERYSLTSGLYNLIFQRIPETYTPDDLKEYGKILLQTHAFRQGYDPNRQVNSNKGYKYMNIIKPLLKSMKTGSGMTLTNHKIDYVHWDDPNELCDRLRLLLASEQAGNAAHSNEIQSIVEELYESNVIKGGRLSRLF